MNIVIISCYSWKDQWEISVSIQSELMKIEMTWKRSKSENGNSVNENFNKKENLCEF